MKVSEVKKEKKIPEIKIEREHYIDLSHYDPKLSLANQRIAREFNALQIRIASPEEMLSWSYGEVKKPDTISYRNNKPERDGLYCERIFGPEVSYQCSCGRYSKLKGKQFEGVKCDRCGVDVINSKFRRYRFGHIELAAPVVHPWLLKKISQATVSPLPAILSVKWKPEIWRLKLKYYKENDGKKYEKEIKQLKTMLHEEQWHDLSNWNILMSVIMINTHVVVEDVPEREDVIKTVPVKKTPSGSPVKSEGKEDFRHVTLYAGTVIHNDDYDDLINSFPQLKNYFAIGADALEKLLKTIEKNEIEFVLKLLRQEIEASRKLDVDSAYKSLYRFLVNVIKGMENYRFKPEYLMLRIIPVVPPELRPIAQLEEGKTAKSDLTNLYRHIIIRNKRLREQIHKKLPDVILRSSIRALQDAVNNLIDISTSFTPRRQKQLKSLTEHIMGKQGRFRQNLLAKRVDFSGRAVVVVGSHLKLHQCGIAKSIALELYKPFVEAELNRMMEAKYGADMTRLRQQGRTPRRIIENALSKVSYVEEEDLKMLWEALEKVMSGTVVLLNRAPTLHRLSILAFEPVLINENVIQLHPLVCAGFNADFDGDQLAVHLPIYPEAQLEAKALMLSTKNLFVPGSGKPAVIPTQDMIVGIYYLTFSKKGMPGEGMYFSDIKTPVELYERGVIKLNSRIKILGLTEMDDDFDTDNGKKFTTPGRLIFHSALPKDYPFESVNKLIMKKDISNIVEDIFRRYGPDAVVETVEKLKEIGFKYVTKSGTTLGLSDIVVPDEKHKVIKDTEKEDEYIRKAVEVGEITLTEGYQELLRAWDLAATELENKMVSKLKEFNESEYDESSTAIFNPLYAMVISGARGNIDQIRQLGAMRGWMANPVQERKGFVGELIGFPIKSNFKEGLSIIEYFISTYGARKTTADTATSTREPGATTRIILNAVLHEPVVTEEDCGTTDGITKMAILRGSEVILPLSERIQGRVSLKPIATLEGEVLVKAGEVITKEIAEKIEKHFDSIAVRSVLRCKAKEGVCRKCYGINPATGYMVDIAEAVGVTAAQAVGEATTQLVLRTFHIGGTERIVEQKIVSPRKGRVEITTDKEFIPVPGKKNQYWCISHNAYIKISGHERYDIPYGARVFVKNGDEVAKDEILAQWQANLKPLISEWEGVVYYKNIIKGKNAQIIKDELTKKPKLFIYRSGAAFEIKLKDGKTITLPIPVDTHIDVKNGTKVIPGSMLGYTQVISSLHTADIIAGLPRIISLFNVYPPDEQTKAILSNVMGQVSFIAPQSSVYKIIWIQPHKEEIIKKYEITDTIKDNNEDVKIKTHVFKLSEPAINKLHEIVSKIVEPKSIKEFKDKVIEGINSVEEKSIRHELYKVRYFIEKDLYKKLGGLHIVDIRSRRIIVEKDKLVHVGDPLTTGPVDYRELLEKVDLTECERKLLDEIQLILRTRGAAVDDKHVEMILKSMFSFVVIDSPGDSHFFKGDIVARKVLEEENERLRKAKKKPAVFSPYLEGCKMIPQRILQSGLSVFQPSSFQYNRWMLLDAAVRGQVEEFKGLHENLIIGRRIPAGTGFFK